MVYTEHAYSQQGFKLLTSCLRDSLFSLLKANGVVEHSIQKGVLSKLPGTFEHTVQMATIINTARIKQRSPVITLLALKNVFGDGHHNCISEVLRYHHVLDQIQQLIQSLNSNFQMSIVKADFHEANCAANSPQNLTKHAQFE